tara:strand:- start:1549 stop:3171 length:1623 start_codon:yes stop_codon:yes gene_type:complete
MITKNIVLEVSEDFTNEWFVHSTTPQEKTDIISIGSLIFKESKCKILNHYKRSSTERKELEKMIDIEILKLQEKHKTEMDTLKAKYDNIIGINELLVDKINHLEPQIKILKDELFKNESILFDEKKKYKKQVTDEYEDKIKLLQHQLQQTYKEHQLREDHIRKSYEDKIDKIRDQHNSFQSIYTNSSKKGDIGELNAYNTLLKLLPTAILNDTHTETGCGDIHIHYKDVKILYENKNYHSKNVPKKEIQKFIRDVTITNDCDCGIMASQNTGIANKDNFSISYTENGKPILYLHKTIQNESNIKVGIELLVSAIQNNIVFEESKIAKIKNILHTIEELKKNNEKHRRNIEPFINTYKENKLFIIKLANEVKDVIGYSPDELMIGDIQTTIASSKDISNDTCKNEDIIFISNDTCKNEDINVINKHNKEKTNNDAKNKEISKYKEINNCDSIQLHSEIKPHQKQNKKLKKVENKKQHLNTSSPSTLQCYMTWMNSVREEIKKDIVNNHQDNTMELPISIFIVKEAHKRWITLTNEERKSIQ